MKRISGHQPNETGCQDRLNAPQILTFSTKPLDLNKQTQCSSNYIQFHSHPIDDNPPPQGLLVARLLWVSPLISSDTDPQSLSPSTRDFRCNHCSFHVGQLDPVLAPAIVDQSIVDLVEKKHVYSCVLFIWFPLPLLALSIDVLLYRFNVL